MRVLVLAALAGAAAAACSNGCSGHGTCSANDICTCFPNYQGADCSLRTCPFGDSWALDAADPHAYEECSGAGICDRSSGECKCFDGFSGFSCQRRACPNDCSGHGSCRLLSEIETVVPYDAAAWDAQRIQACVCDAGFFGTDCSQRRCPTGDDPLTLCDSTVRGMVQEVKLTLGSRLDYEPSTLDGSAAHAAIGISQEEGMDLFGTSATKNFKALQEEGVSAQLRVGARDAFGQVHYAPTAAGFALARDAATRGNAADPGNDALEVALESIPGAKVRNVQVASEFVGPSNGGIAGVMSKRYLVTFVPNEQNSANVGQQQQLVCDSGYGCTTAGCSPRVSMPFLYRYAATTAEQTSLDTTPVAPAAVTFDFFTGAANSDAAFLAKQFIRLDSSSMPRLPPGVPVDTGAAAGAADRYDIRVVIAVGEPGDLPTDAQQDLYWTKVTYTHTNITADAFGYAGSSNGVFSSSGTKEADFVGTLNGFTFRGFVPASLTAALPDVPGVTLSFPSSNLVAQEGAYRFYEILVKLPACTVTPLVTGTEFTAVGGAAIAPVDSAVENVECSNRGQCNRETGLCECFEGYFGLACHRQTVLV